MLFGAVEGVDRELSGDESDCCGVRKGSSPGLRLLLRWHLVMYGVEVAAASPCDESASSEEDTETSGLDARLSRGMGDL